MYRTKKKQKYSKKKLSSVLKILELLVRGNSYTNKLYYKTPKRLIQWPSVITTTDITSNGYNDNVSLVPAKMVVCKSVFPTDITSTVITTNGYNDAIRMVPLRLFVHL